MIADKIFKHIKQDEEINSEYFTAELEEIEEYAEDMSAYFNVYLENDIRVPMILIGKYGIHVFLKIDKTANFAQISPLIQKVVYKYHLGPKTTFWGKNEGLNEAFLITEDKKIIKIEDLVGSFINFYKNERRTEAEIKRLNFRCKEDYLRSESELKEEYSDELFDKNSRGYVREILSDEMIEFYKSKFEEDIKEHEIRTDIDGNEYIKREKKMKILGITTGEAYYRLSDEDSEKMYYITLFGGIFGLHHLLRGDFLRSILYMITGGGFSVLYIADMISICLGTYAYDEVKYGINENGKQIRQKEKVYLRPIEGIKKRIFGIIAAIFIGITFTFFVIKPGYSKINYEISNASTEAANEYIESKYKEIIETYSE